MNEEIEKVKEFLITEVDRQLNSLLEFNTNQSSLLEFELTIQKNIKELGRIILERMIPAVFGDGYEGTHVEESEEETYSCVLRKNKRALKTIFGNIEIIRAYYQNDQDGSSLGLLDKKLEIHNYKISPALRYFAGLMGTVTTFREGADILKRINGITISSSEIDVLTEEKAKQAYEMHDKEIEYIQHRHDEKIDPAKIKVEKEPKRLIYLECDGCFVPTMDDWKECKTLLLFEVGEKGMKKKRYYSTTNSALYFKKQVRVKLEQYCGDDNVKIICIGDGAKWIWRMCKELIPNGRVDILDWYHVEERIGLLAAELFQDNETEKEEFRTEIKGYFYNGKSEEGIEKLHAIHDETKDRELSEMIQKQITYFENNKERMNYPKYIEEGYAIGSGAIESANKYVIQRRLKLPGIRWTSENANHMAHIRTEYINGELDNLYGIKENPLMAAT